MGKMILSGSVLVQDPCYDRETSLNLVEVVPGPWRFTVARGRKSWVKDRVTALLAWSETIARPNIPDLRRLGTRLPFEVGVDSGQVSIVCNTLYPLGDVGEYGDANSFYGRACNVTIGDRGYGGIRDDEGVVRGVASQTAWGDGVYVAYAQMRDGKAEAITIITI